MNFVLDKDRAAQYGITEIPAVALLRGRCGHAHAVPGRARPAMSSCRWSKRSCLPAADDSGLSEASRKLIAEHVSEPLDIQVFVTPTCPHCPRAVTLAHRMAVEHPLIRATCVEATEFMDLTRQYRVTGVPKTIVNGTIEILGAVPEDTFVNTVLQQPPDPADGLAGANG